MILSVSDIVALHDRTLSRWQDASDPGAGEAPPGVAAVAGAGSLGEMIEAAHFANFTIWGLEDEARRRDVGDARIAAVKRAIDPWNQRRNDLIEAIDAAILEAMADVSVEHAELHSETAGMIIDRLSVLALKIRNMKRIAEDAALHREELLAAECLGREAILQSQREDLSGCLARLLEDFAAGRRYFRSYLQMKAYNDERLNPALRAAARGRT